MIEFEEIWQPPDHVEHHHTGACDCEPTVAYVRVSRVGDRQFLVSPQIQLDSAIAECRRKKKRIVKVIADIDKSGRTFTKRSVDTAISLISSGRAKSITVWKWSRWGRNLEFSLAYLSKTRAAGGRVDSATEDIDQSTATGRLHRDVTMRFDQFQSEVIGETWMSVHDVRRKDGLPINGRPRFGYISVTRKMLEHDEPHEGSEACDQCRAKKPKPHFITHPVEGPVLVECYERYIAGWSFARLADDLNARGFRTAMGGLWTREGLQQMMDTGFAAGWLRERSPGVKEKLRAEGKQLRNSPETFDVWRRGVQPTLIDDKIWEAYKSRRSDQRQLPPRGRSAVHTLSTLLFCQVCSMRLSAKYPGGKRELAWYCVRQKRFHPDINVSVTNRAALPVVRAWIREHAKPPSPGLDLDQEAKRRMLSDGAGRSQAQILADIERETRAIDRLVSLLARDKIDEVQFDSAKAEAEETLRLLNEEMKALVETEGPDGRPPYAAFGTLGEVWDEALSAEPGSLNEPLRKVISFIIVSPAAGRPRRAGVPRDEPLDVSGRVEVVGRWEASSKDSWLRARRRRFDA